MCMLEFVVYLFSIFRILYNIACYVGNTSANKGDPNISQDTAMVRSALAYGWPNIPRESRNQGRNKCTMPIPIGQRIFHKVVPYSLTTHKAMVTK